MRGAEVPTAAGMEGLEWRLARPMVDAGLGAGSERQQMLVASPRLPWFHDAASLLQGV